MRVRSERISRGENLGGQAEEREPGDVRFGPGPNETAPRLYKSVVIISQKREGTTGN